MQDERILDLYFARDERAIDETDKKYGPYCRTVAENILQYRQDAEECVNDTWLRTWNAIPPHRPRVLKLYLARITRNLAISSLRKLGAQMRGGGTAALCLDELAQCLPGPDSAETALEAKELRRAMAAFLKTLSTRDRDIFLRRYFYVCTTQAIAKEYGLQEQNVLVILSRTRKKLKQHLEKGGFSL